MRSSPDDLTARARIRDAAMQRFARDGFDTPLRAIAADAGVSAALVIHHFGTKDGLRAACDAHVLEVVGDELATTMRHATPEQTAARIAEADDLAPIVAYLVRSLLAGGALAAHLVDGLVEASARYLADGVADGAVRAGTDVAAMARVLVAVDLGLLLVAQVRASAGTGPAPTSDPRAAIAAMGADVRAVLELYTHGVFADSSYLDAYDLAVTAQAAPPPVSPSPATPPPTTPPPATPPPTTTTLEETP
ncbi:TetR family transcriptional regulator [Cellulomonas fulva]|uniref:TetR family transcriptional regulator n=1 Tax=Cellulomonas fulva TaxID=2835530 RepID=UPI0027DB6FFF|nr:TetR family transcriptional regulator [Cellulomonas fulva]